MNLAPLSFARSCKHLLACLLMGVMLNAAQARTPLVLMTDFGVADGAVSAMRGVAFGVDADLNISDLTHQIPDYDIWAGAYRLYQTVDYWPQGTVFVTVVDPGVGTARKSIVLKTKNGRYFVGPDNGLYTLIAERDGIAEMREIDERVNRLPGSGESYTFHGRDVYAYTGARLASGTISFEQVGPVLDPASLVRIPYQQPSVNAGVLSGNIPVLDVKYGNVWSNIPKAMLDSQHVKAGDKLRVRIYRGSHRVAELVAPFANSFGDVPKGQPLVYVNSLLNVAVALNQGNFAARHKVESGADWHLEVSKQP
jgi:S-adenosylmethionine hydrolase